MTTVCDHNTALYGLCHVLSETSWAGSATQVARFLSELLDARRVAVFLTDSSGGSLRLAGAFAPGDAMWSPPPAAMNVMGDVYPACPLTVATLGNEPVLLGRNSGGYDLSRVLTVVPSPAGDDQIAAVALRHSALGLIGLALVVGKGLSHQLNEGAIRLSLQAITDVLAERRRTHLLTQRVISAEQDSQRRRTLKRHTLDQYCTALVGNSDQIVSLRKAVPEVSHDTQPVVILGEAGVGRADIAREVHQRSSRRGARFVHVDLSTVGPGMAMPILCGYRAGAAFGQAADSGLFAEANGGTLCLRGIETLSDAEQAMLLRILEKRRFAPIGSNAERRLTARIIALAPSNLPDLCSKALFLILSSHLLRVPSIRERREDIPAILSALLSDTGRDDIKISADALSEIGARLLEDNLIELRLILERALAKIDATELVLRSRHLEFSETENRHELETFGAGKLRPTIARFEKALIQHVLNAAGGDRAEAARQLHIPKRTLADKCHRYAL